MAGTDAGSKRGAIMDTETGVDIERIVGSAYLQHHGQLQRYLTGITRDPAAAEDLTHDAFERLTAEVQAGRVPDDFGAWLHRVGHNLAMSRGRRISVADRRRAELVVSDWMPSPESLTVAGEEQQAVSAVLEGLGQVDRQALVLAAHGYRGAEIARTIGRSDVATRTLLCRARAKVRTLMLARQPELSA
jgi:RNA polymerase sigma factor (sigma-70 family)